MAFNKRTWKGRQGTGLNKFSIGGATPVTIINQPDSVTEQGDALSAGNMNDLENRIYTAFEEEATARDDADTALKAAVAKNTAEIENLKQTTGQQEITVSYPDDGNYPSLMPNKVPLSVADYAEIPRFRGKTRAWNSLYDKKSATTTTEKGIDFKVNSDGTITVGGSSAQTATGLIIFNCNVSSLSNYGLNHKILVLGCPSGGSSSTYWLGGLNSGEGRFGEKDTGGGTIISVGSTYGLKDIIINIESGTTINSAITFRPIVRDLTLIFGAGNEPATVADALAQLPALGQYNAYDAGSLVDTVVSGARSKDTNDNVLDTLSLSTPVTLRSAGSVAGELDVETGVITRKVGVVDLGTLNWLGGNGEFYVLNVDTWLKLPLENSVAGNVICPRYTTKAYIEPTDKSIYTTWESAATKALFVRDSSYSDTTTFKNAINGVYLNYELATPTTESIDPVPDNFLEVEGGGTIETIQTQTPVLDNCIDVTYDIIPA